ncbi:hypothetical protein [Brevundimonas naejangsanensis]|uniref:hypothetical protein n=1 Tax=Brevundimonas naejangsanensis TaxID=588932 RepID=UPI003D02CC79
MSDFNKFVLAVAALETGEEQDGHASGADAIGILDRLILDARARVVAKRETDQIDPTGVALITSMRDMMDDVAGFLPPDCGIGVQIAAADIYLETRRAADQLCPEGIELIGSMRSLINEAIDVHIYHHDDVVPEDCGYHAVVDQADLYLAARELASAG